MRTPATIASMILLVSFLAAGPAGASIPPTYQVLVVSADDEARARAEALVQYMSASGGFARQAPTAFYPSTFIACLEGADFAACARPLIPAPSNWRDPAPVVIRVEMVGEGDLALTCVGSGAHRPPTDDQVVTVDPQAAIFGQSEARTAQLRAAMACIQAAALESSQP